MKAKNSKEVARGYILFAVAMFCSIVVGLGCVWLFLMTANREMTHMETRSMDYDATFSKQLALAENVESLYKNIMLLNSGVRFNEEVLQNRISNHKMQIIDMLNNINKSDALLYGKMFDQINSMLHVKDSIRLMRSNVEQTKGALKRCIEDNLTAARKTIFMNPSN